jgi:hypothetical protein
MEMSFKPLLRHVAEKTASGRTPSYGEAQILRALEITSEGDIGRAALGVRLGVGEGVVRTIIKRLISDGLIEVTTRGISTSKKGQRLLKEAHAIIVAGSEVPSTEDTVGKYNYALLIKGAFSKVRFGLEQRDAALLAGAKGATTIIFSNGAMIIPGMDRPPTTHLASSLRDQLSLSEGDTIVVGTGDTAIEAEIGAYSAALTLV